MPNKKLLILTSRFPYEGGEYFLETEIKYWRKVDGVDVYLLPFFRAKGIRTYPEWVNLRSENSERGSRSHRVKYLLIALISPIFWGELVGLIKKRNLNMANLVRALLMISRIFQIKKTIKVLLNEVGGVDLVYSYWNSTSSYAAALLKKEGLIKKIITRAHGSDLYRYALKNEYMPIKERVVDQFDVVATVSRGGRKYYIDEYSVPPEKVLVSRLGVEIDGRLSRVSESKSFSLVSISNCVKIKRLEVVAEGVLIFAAKNPDVHVTWTHVGDGPTLAEVKDLWSQGSAELSNVSASFLGRLPNRAVIDFLAQSPCDLIVNASASEGVPVSLMEAMSFGIPALAPSIGGIPELITDERGFLLPPMPTSEDFAKGLELSFPSVKNPRFREESSRFIAQEYAASKVYSDFYELVLSNL
jgi:colanic acid/amylovoran biosynthesis glycosyltransferase